MWELLANGCCFGLKAIDKVAQKGDWELLASCVVLETKSYRQGRTKRDVGASSSCVVLGGLKAVDRADKKGTGGF